jgi:hypothetical protein
LTAYCFFIRILTFVFAIQLNPWRKAFLENFIIFKLVKKFLSFYGMQRFSAMFTRTWHWSMSSTVLFQFILSYPVSLRCILILTSSLKLDIPCGHIPPLWSSGQSSWLKIRRPGFNSRRYQIFWGGGDQKQKTKNKKQKKRKTSSGSGPGSTQPREYNLGATW